MSVERKHGVEKVPTLEEASSLRHEHQHERRRAAVRYPGRCDRPRTDAPSRIQSLVQSRGASSGRSRHAHNSVRFAARPGFVKARQPPQVRFNDEVVGALEVKTTKAVNAGDPVYFSDIADISRFELNSADADAGHFTVFKWDGGWRIFFDFQRNRRSAADLVASAEQFTATAELALERGFQGPFVDNLFNASELLARARLITAAAEDEVKTHRMVGAKINLWGRLGNVEERFLSLFNELSRLREQARYRGGAPVLKADDPLERIRAEISSLRQRLNRFSDDPA